MTRVHDAPADGRDEIVANKKRGAMLEAHAPLRVRESGKPGHVDQNRCTRSQNEQPGDSGDR
jgi:hypothetical protein